MKGLRAVFELYCDYRQSDSMKPSTYYNTLPYMYRLYSALNIRDSSVGYLLSLVRVEMMTVVIDLIFM